MKTLNPIALTCALALLLVLSVATTAAQSVTGSMFGSVLDSTGSAVQGAQLKLVYSTTGAERAAITDARGEFAINTLGPGRYSLTVEARGFKKLVRDDIELTPSERLSLGSLKLELGTVTEQVLVSSAATPVQTASAERSTSLTADEVTNLTMYGRTVTSLVALSPGVVDTIGANNRALGGGGGTGGTGGNGSGGGLYVASGAALTLADSTVQRNKADGGTGGAGGSDGQGIGGGVYDIGTFSFDAATVITKNHASTSHNNIGP